MNETALLAKIVGRGHLCTVDTRLVRRLLNKGTVQDRKREIIVYKRCKPPVKTVVGIDGGYI